MTTLMSKITTVVFVCLITIIPTIVGAGNMEKYNKIPGYVTPGPDEVNIGPCCIGMPLGRILLVHKDSMYCSVSFTKFWTEKDGKEKFAIYDVYYQKDGTGDFKNKKVKFSTEKASFLELRGVFYPLIWQPGKPEIKCGPLSLAWSPWSDVCHVCFFEGADPDGDYGIELAPTPWTNITEVNVFEPRVKWYKYDEGRNYINIPIYKLWDDTEMKKEK